ncbi:MAG: discoidin domain-containing protein, partial [Limosilactobacillus sp.]
QNLAFNPHDQVAASGAYPHVSANVETRDESVFFAKNVVDGKYANLSHGGYPFDSWGINSQDDAKIKVDLGRQVKINRLKLLFRSDYPHDNYWKSVSVRFSNGDVKTFATTNSLEFQNFYFDEVTTTSVELFDLVKADDHSEFPALQQLEAYGYNL